MLYRIQYNYAKLQNKTAETLFLWVDFIPHHSFLPIPPLPNSDAFHESKSELY